MQKKLLGYDQVSRVFEPSFEQISLSKFFEDPLNVYILGEGASVKIFDKSGRTIKAYAKSYGNGLILSCRLPCSSFQYGQKILIFIDVGSKSYALQTIIRSAHFGDLYVEDTSTRFYPRFKTTIRATARPLPAHYVNNILEGKWYIERTTETSEAGKYRIKDMMFDWKSSGPIGPSSGEEKYNVLLTSISQGGFALTRNIDENTKPLKHVMVSCGYYLKGAFIQLELLAIARQSVIDNGIETISFCLVSPLASMSEDIFPHEKKLSLSLSEKVEIYVNGDIRGHNDKINLLLPPGSHKIKLIAKCGTEYEEEITIDSFEDDLHNSMNYHLFRETPLTCVAVEKEHDLVSASGI